MLEAAIVRNVRQLEVIFPACGELQQTNISTVYAYVERFGKIVSCEKTRNGLDIRLIEVDGVSMYSFNRYHEIDGHRVFMRRDVYFLDLPLFCLKEICKWLLNSIEDLCSVTEVCTTLKDAAILAFEEKFSKTGTRITLKKELQTDVRLLQCFHHSITRLEIEAEDREHFTNILSALKKWSPNFLKYLIFSNKRPSYRSNKYSEEYNNHFSNITTPDMNELLTVFSHLEGISFNTEELICPRLPPNLRIFNMDLLYRPIHPSRPTFDTINANLQKVIFCSPFAFDLFETQLLQSSPQIKEITIEGWHWIDFESTDDKTDDINYMIKYAPQLEVLGLYTENSYSNPSIAHLQALKKMRSLKILNLSLTNPSIELLNAINELNVVVECLILFVSRMSYEISISIRNFIHLKFLRIELFTPLKEIAELVACLPQLSVLILKKNVFTLDYFKKIISACSKLTDIHVGKFLDFNKNLETEQYLEIVSAARGRPIELQLRIWLSKYCSTNIDSKVFSDNVKYVDVQLKFFKYKSYPPCGFTV